MTSAMVYVDSHYYILHLMTEIMNSLPYLLSWFPDFLDKIAGFMLIYG